MPCIDVTYTRSPDSLCRRSLLSQGIIESDRTSSAHVCILGNVDCIWHLSGNIENGNEG